MNQSEKDRKLNHLRAATLAGEWEHYRAMVLPRVAADSVQFKETQAAFYGGFSKAAHLLTTATDFLSEQEGTALMLRLAREIRAFAQSQIAAKDCPVPESCMSLAELETAFHSVNWRESIRISSEDGSASGYACKICIAQYGFKAEDIAGLPQDKDWFPMHLANVHDIVL